MTSWGTERRARACSVTGDDSACFRPSEIQLLRAHSCSSLYVFYSASETENRALCVRGDDGVLALWIMNQSSPIDLMHILFN